MIVSTNSSVVKYTLFRKRTKNIRIRVTGRAEVVVSAPYHVAEARVRGFVENNREKILSALEEIGRKRNLYYPETYSGGETFYYLGQESKLKTAEGARPRAEFDGESLTLFAPRGSGAETFRKIFIKWVRAEAGRVFMRRADMILPLFPLAEEIKISVRNMLSRWGSINVKRRTMSLSVHLLRCEEELIDYIITHELCHLSYRAHSKEFYRELESYFPQRKRLDKRLKEYGLVDFY